MQRVVGVDETYIKVRGVWTYLYCVVDNLGRTIDFPLSTRREASAARRFFRKTLCREKIWAYLLTRMNLGSSGDRTSGFKP